MKAKNLLKKAFLLLALVGGATSAWATTESFINGTSTASGSNYSGTSFSIAGTYILGNGSTKSGNMTSKGQKVKCVANTDGDKVIVISVKDGYTINSVTLHANINKDNKTGTLSAIKVDGNNATGFTSTTIPARNSDPSASCDVTISDDATSNITLYFTDMGSDQMNMELFVTFTPPPFTVTYKANGGTGDDVVDGDATEIADMPNTWTAPANKDFSNWNTASDGSGSSYEVGVSVPSDLTLYAQWTDAPLFSIDHITGPTDKKSLGSIANLEARVRGGSAEIYYNKDNVSLLQSKGGGSAYYDLNFGGSGGHYLHVVFPTKLQAGDVITLPQTDTGKSYTYKIALTAASARGGSGTEYTFPLTLVAGTHDALIGATELYITKGSQSIFGEMTITGTGTRADLALTSSQNVEIVGKDNTSQILYSSSNTTGAVTYTCDDESVATVSSTGLITAKGGGSATITVNQASDGTYRAAAVKLTVTVRVATEVTGQFLLDTNNGAINGGKTQFKSTDTSVVIEGSFDTGSDTYDDLLNSHTRLNAGNFTITLPSNYSVSSMWLVGYKNGDGAATTITLKEVDGVEASAQSGTLGANDQRPTADCVGFTFATPAEESIVVNIGNQTRGYFILNPEVKNITMNQVGTKYYATFYSAGEVTIAGAKAYTAAYDSEDKVLTLTECENGIVGGKTGVILIGNSASATATPSFTGATKSVGDLIGVGQKAVAMGNYYAASTSAANKVFVLGNNDGVGFFKYTGTSLGVNKAYLYNETIGNSARAISFRFGGNITSIDGVNVETVKAELKKFFENGKLIIEKDGKRFNAAGAKLY